MDTDPHQRTCRGDACLWSLSMSPPRSAAPQAPTPIWSLSPLVKIGPGPLIQQWRSRSQLA
eukprot:15478081-Alexandrium_andersonii.AAC.1